MSFLSRIRDQQNFYKHIADAQKNINVVREDYVNAETKRRNDEIRADIKQDLSAELLYCDENINNAIIISRLLKDYLVLKDPC